MQSEELRSRIIGILEEYKVLNSSAICRALNRQPPMPPKGFCHGGQPFGATRTFTPYTVCKALSNHCSPTFLEMSSILKHLLKEGLVKQTKKFPFRDTGLARWDYFTFWYLNEEEFNNKILKQTLRPYQHQEKSLDGAVDK